MHRPAVNAGIKSINYDKRTRDNSLVLFILEVNKMTYFKLPNSIFSLGLKANELTVLGYLFSIHKPEHQAYVVAKQEAIARASGYASRDSAQNAVASLAGKGFLTIVPRHNTFTGVTLANGYILHLPTSGGYFRVDRQRFRAVAARAGATGAAVYLFILRCVNRARTAFPSLTAIRDAVGLTITTIVKKLRALEEALLLHKQNRRKLDGSFAHNLYTLLLGTAREAQAEKPETGQKKKHALAKRVFPVSHKHMSKVRLQSTYYTKGCGLICQGLGIVKSLLTENPLLRAVLRPLLSGWARLRFVSGLG